MIAAVPAALAVIGSPEGALEFVLLALRWVLLAVLERQTQRDSTTGPEKPIGIRGAYADNKTT